MDLQIPDKHAGNKRNFTYTRVPRSPDVCVFWKQGRCTRASCKFRHSEEPEAPERIFYNGFSQKRGHQLTQDSDMQQAGAASRRTISTKWGRGLGGRVTTVEREKVKDKVCSYWLSGNCKFGDDCKFLHSHFTGSEIAFVTQLTGHDKTIRGFAFPVNSIKLYSGGQDRKVIAWDCQTGEGKDILFEEEVGCIFSEGPWLFVGIMNFVKAWNTVSLAELTLDGPKGQVHALAVGNGMLLAGTHDGSILAWKFDPETNTFQPAASLAEHKASVISLAVKGSDKLYSGSMDKSIKVWDLATFQCIQTVTNHTEVVMSLLSWEQYLLSCSLDNTVKVWHVAPSGMLEEVYTHNEEYGVLALCGMIVEQDKPILLCSCNDNTVKLYDLPTFAERCRLFTKTEVRALHVGPGGLFFTGDGMGELKVWKWTNQKV